LNYLFAPASEPDVVAANRIRALTKTVFDFVRNVMILGVVLFVAQKTSSVYLWGIYYTCLTVLGMYIISYWQAWDIKLFRWSPWKIFGEVADLVLTWQLE
jgi:hypothetical protein